MLNGIDPPEVTNFAKFIDEKEVHNYLHVGLHNFEIFNFKVHDKFNPEIMGGDGKAMESVLDGYKVLLYSGQMDPVIPHMHVSKAVDALQWSKADEYKKAPRKIWKVDDDVAGYIRTTGNFTYITLRKTGRYAVMDQPKWGFEMIQNFIEDKPF
jgi:vitellogenic carboxypeptidase-like protein